MVMTLFAAFNVYPPGDAQISRAVQSAALPGLPVLSEAVYWSGVAPWFYLLGVIVAGSLLALRHRLLAAFTFVALLAYNSVFLIKILVERPRPSSDLVEVARVSSGFSFPSGHVMSAVMLWGFVIFASHVIRQRALRLGVQLFSAGMIVLMGLQRVHAGAHWPTDVLAAYLWGAVVLISVIKLFEVLRDSRWGSRAPTGQTSGCPAGSM
jgi:undecaprenyl-diphosphatase